jgi:hypothetical protein
MRFTYLHSSGPRTRDDSLRSRMGVPAHRAPSRRAGSAHPRARRRQRRAVPDGHGQRGPAPPARVPVRRPTRRHPANRDRRLDLPSTRAPARLHLPDAPRPHTVPRPARVPPRALPRLPGRHPNMAPVGRRKAALPRPPPRAAGATDGPPSHAVNTADPASGQHDRARTMAQRDRHAPRRVDRRLAQAQPRYLSWSPFVVRGVQQVRPKPPAGCRAVLYITLLFGSERLCSIKNTIPGYTTYYKSGSWSHVV